jgi:phage repressor protein C with HTH and peptisase S24 domain
MKQYRANYTGKAEFVKDVLSPLLYQADTGWFGAEYEYDKTTHEERVYLLTPEGYRSNAIGVNGDSLEAMVRDVFKNL